MHSRCVPQGPNRNKCHIQNQIPGKRKKKIRYFEQSLFEETSLTRVRFRETIRDSTAVRLFSVLSASFPRTLKYSGIKLTTVLRSAKVKSRGIRESEATQQGGSQENKDLDFICPVPHLSFFPSISGQRPDSSEAPHCVTSQSAPRPLQDRGALKVTCHHCKPHS